MQPLKWRTEKRKLKDLIPFESNPRQLTEKQYEDLKKSLSKFDLAEIPAIDTQNKIIAGHQRIKILSELKGINYEIDVRVPNRNLTKKEFEEYNIRSNKNTGTWDFDILANEFEVDELKEWGFNERELGGISIEQINELEEWKDANIEDFQIAEKQPKIIFYFKNEKARQKFIDNYGFKIYHKQANQWTVMI